MIPAGFSLPFLTSRDGTHAARDRIETLSKELGSGRVSDLGRALSSDFSLVSRLTHDMKEADAVADSLALAASWGEATQIALDQIAMASDRLVEALPSTFATQGRNGLDQVAEVGRGALNDIVSALQGELGGRSLFANGAVESPIVAAEGILTDIEVLAAGASDFDAYAQSVDAFFAPGGVFETVHVNAFPADPVRFPAGDGGTIAFVDDALSTEVVDALKQAALTAGLSSTTFDTTPSERSVIASHLQERSAEVGVGLPLVQARIGATEARIATRAEAVDARRLDAESALADSVGIDPFEVATRLQDEMSRLEALYATTARRSQLRLTNFL